MTRTLVLALLVAACAAPEPVVVQTDRPLPKGDIETIRREVKAALPLDCAAYDLVVKGDQAAFTYVCMAR